MLHQLLAIVKSKIQHEVTMSNTGTNQNKTTVWDRQVIVFTKVRPNIAGW